MPNTKYKPISCSFYDRLENWSILKHVCTIRYRKFDEETIVEGVIVDVFMENKEEFLKLNTGDQIRLDMIIDVNGIPLRRYC